MRLLILTQAVDRDDPVLGFFHRWIEEFSKKYEKVNVICLGEGRHQLPVNVAVHSLGKERGVSRIEYVLAFYRYIWTLRNEYDAVFVHMNQEYVLLGSLLWLLWGKRVVLWRNHRMGSLLTRIAGALAHVVCFTSPAAYVAHFPRSRRMPIGIDTERFAPRGEKSARSVLFLGRLDQVKNADVFVQALRILAEQKVQLHASLYGDPTVPDSQYVREIRTAAASLAGLLSVHAGVTNEKAAELFASHEIYVNLTPSGSFDKTIGEAMAAGCTVVAYNDAVRSVLPAALFVERPEAQPVASALKVALNLSAEEKEALSKRQRSFVVDTHSLVLLSAKLAEILR
ncbi:MAG: glycosyltransferase family 4 protein [Candidatus Kaiserbacteria bacterium]|nr:MAG: glycosyltransferase family 4 protein [Candidatus Kaiserbacteria bacterium]